MSWHSAQGDRIEENTQLVMGVLSRLSLWSTLANLFSVTKGLAVKQTRRLSDPPLNPVAGQH